MRTFTDAQIEHGRERALELLGSTGDPLWQDLAERRHHRWCSRYWIEAALIDGSREAIGYAMEDAVKMERLSVRVRAALSEPVPTWHRILYAAGTEPALSPADALAECQERG